MNRSDTELSITSSESEREQQAMRSYRVITSTFGPATGQHAAKLQRLLDDIEEYEGNSAQKRPFMEVDWVISAPRTDLSSDEKHDVKDIINHNREEFYKLVSVITIALEDMISVVQLDQLTQSPRPTAESIAKGYS